MQGLTTEWRNFPYKSSDMLAYIIDDTDVVRLDINGDSCSIQYRYNGSWITIMASRIGMLAFVRDFKFEKIDDEYSMDIDCHLRFTSGELA